MLQGWQLIEGKALVVVWGILEWKVGCGVEMAGTGFVLVMLRPMLMMLVALLGQMVRWCWVEGGIGLLSPVMVTPWRWVESGSPQGYLVLKLKVSGCLLLMSDADLEASKSYEHHRCRADAR
ncbi:hypothetical protein M9H77_08398 [Catharanthus roseus]|uniref:Uncharacterized protein n=1 Tax=Catharanthus roseus TaxID=4058 RepID=A0ACC0BXY5_CATRO|nr:hypothetical protein M9H77_08398 [Catharanthus roseus]